MKTAESIIAEYLYEYITCRKIPTVSTPATFISAVGKNAFNYFLPFGEDKIREVIATLTLYEKNSKKNIEQKVPHVATLFSGQDDDVFGDNSIIWEKYKWIHHPRLFEFHDFLLQVDDEFVITLVLRAGYIRTINTCQLHGRPISSTGDKKVYEFLIGLGGISVVNTAWNPNRVKDRWKYICEKNKYANDFSRLIDAPDPVMASIFAIDYTTQAQNEI